MNRAYYGWLAGSTLSAFGDTALFFALGWAATSISPQVAGLVLTGFTLPRAVLLLLGGVLGDRFGPRRMLLACSAIVGCCCFVLAATVGIHGVSAGLLLTTSLAVGTVDAFGLPAAGVLPRLFVADDQLARAMSLRTSVTQLMILVGGPISGLLVATVGLVGTLVLDGLTFAVQFLVLLAIRPPYDVSPSTERKSVVRDVVEVSASAGRRSVVRDGVDVSASAGRRSVVRGVVEVSASAGRRSVVRGAVEVSASTGRKSVVRDAVDGLRVAWTDPILRMILLVVALVAAFVLPVTSLCVPLLARSHGWAAGQTGYVLAGSVTGGLVVTVLVARFGTFPRAGLAGGLGCLVAAAGICGLGLAPTVPSAVAATFVQGLGVGFFTSHLAPVFVSSTPPTHLTRLQSLLSLVQTVPLIASTNLLAILDIHRALTVAATATAAAGVTLLRLEPVATAQRRTAT